MSLILSGTDGLSDVDGSAATPAIRGTDANTGIFFPAADTVATSVAGTEGMRLTSTGLGIGTSSPEANAKLTVKGAGIAVSKDSSTVTPSGFDLKCRSANPQIGIHVTGTAQLAQIEFGTAGDNSFGALINVTGADPLRFGTNGTERARIPAAGGVQAVTTISVGNATPSSSGAGITFPATQSASTDANTLDDYEEGTWSPTITAGSGSFTTVSMSDGVYTKVGNIITCSGKINLTSIGTASGAINVTFPFNASSTAYSGCGFETDAAGFSCGLYPGSTSAFSVKQYNNTSPIIGGGAKIALSITYRAA